MAVTAHSADEPFPPVSYLEWNDAIARRVFRSDMAGREVFLFVDEDLLADIGGEGARDAFVAAVKEGPPWVNHHAGLCQQALEAAYEWRDRELAYPPYIGYLAAFVLAVGLDAGFAAHAYYPRLRMLFGWPDANAGAPPSFRKMYQLWEDLELWSNQDTSGAFGFVTVRFAGEWIHVGLPKAQAVVTEQERRSLAGIFASAGLDPTAPPSDAELARVLRRFGDRALKPRTVALCADPTSDSELFSVLLGVVREELEDWDGMAPVLEEEEQVAAAGMIRICMRLDETTGNARTTLRVASKADFPLEGLKLEAMDQSLTLECSEDAAGWSSPLVDVTTGFEMDAATLNWREPAEFQDPRNAWRVRFPSARVRIFCSAVTEGFSGQVEVRRLPRNTPFVLAACASAASALRTWSPAEVALSEIPLRSGLPSGWSVFKASGASGDSSIRRVLPELSLPTTLRILLRNGIRNGQGNTFFQFAPPDIVVEGGSGAERVTCDGKSLRRNTETGVFQLDAPVRTNTQVTIEVHDGDDVLRRQSLVLSDTYSWNVKKPSLVADKFGSISRAEEVPTLQVAGVISPASQSANFPIRPILPTTSRAFFVGPYVGQISTNSDMDWEPVWIVALERRGNAIYCGLDLERSQPNDDGSGFADDRESWKEVLWYRRKRITPPKHPKVRALWDTYVACARYV